MKWLIVFLSLITQSCFGAEPVPADAYGREIAIAAIELAKQEFPDGLPNSDIRALDEPLMGGPGM